MRIALLTLATLLVTACGATTAAPATSAPPANAAPTETSALEGRSAQTSRADPASTQADPPATQADPTTARPAAPTATSAASAPTASSSAASAPVPTAAPATSAAADSASAASAPPATTLVLDSSVSTASYRAREQLAGRDLPSDAVGTSNGVSGSIVLDQDGSVDPAQSQIKVDLGQLTSDEDRRDNFVRGRTLQTSEFPMATFTPRSVQGLPSPLPSSGQATFQLSGDLTVHGVTKPVTWQVTAQFGSNNVSGNATTDVNISDFGMTPPKAGPVLSIEDGITLELAFSANREA